MYSNLIESQAGSVALRQDMSQDEIINKYFLYSMVTCHGLTHVRGEMVGDPLEMKIFQSTKWKLKEPETFDDMRLLTPPTDDEPKIGSKKPQYDRISLPPSIAPSKSAINDDLEAEINVTTSLGVELDDSK
jgi:hypothetical protein